MLNAAHNEWAYLHGIDQAVQMSGRLEILIVLGCFSATHEEDVFTQWLTAQLTQAMSHHLAAIDFIGYPEVRLPIILDERNVGDW
jgi:hypothetical protein